MYTVRYQDVFTVTFGRTKHSSLPKLLLSNKAMYPSDGVTGVQMKLTKRYNRFS